VPISYVLYNLTEVIVLRWCHGAMVTQVLLSLRYKRLGLAADRQYVRHTFLSPIR